ncbi:hypothetical protein ACTVCO_08195 [Sanguibacter sp. A247]|uniref:hypothetical protein n=1 Tax=unclassified Sanguibacter TaxID=2645534 RepID=UPI003FD738A1
MAASVKTDAPNATTATAAGTATTPDARVGPAGVRAKLEMPDVVRTVSATEALAATARAVLVRVASVAAAMVESVVTATGPPSASATALPAKVVSVVADSETVGARPTLPVRVASVAAAMVESVVTATGPPSAS